MPKYPFVACQGVEGAYSQIAADKIFKTKTNIMYCTDFEGVFAAVDKGMCRYGILPVENSTVTVQLQYVHLKTSASLCI